MAQKTAKTVEDVLEWVENTPHHKAAWRTKDGRDYAAHDDQEAFMVLDGHQDRLRIPLAIQVQTLDLIYPSGRFDTRMFRATEAGLERLAALAKSSPLTGEG